MIKTIVAGAGGRMGGRIVQLIQESPDMILAGAFERKGIPRSVRIWGNGWGWVK